MAVNLSEPALDLSRVDVLDLDDLAAGRLSADDSDACPGHPERSCQEIDQSRVRLPALGRGSHSSAPAVAMAPDELGARRARRDGDRDPGQAVRSRAISSKQAT
jgi:hypothetical protein